MPIIVENNPANAELFSSVTGAGSDIVTNLDDLKRTLAAKSQEFAVVIGPGVDLEAAVALADTLRVTRPAVSVILSRRRVDTSVLAEALRSGMREVVEERDLTGLGSAVARARQVWEALNGPAMSSANAEQGQVVTIFSPKGGVGKTTIAVNLAVALTAGGKKRVCVVDLDLGFGDVAITLQLFPARTIADAVPFESALDVSLLEPLLTPYRDGLFALVAPVQPDAKDSIPASLVGKILHLLRNEFDFVVVDSAPAFDEHVLQALDQTDALLLVTTLDVPTIKNVKIAVETLDLLNFPVDRRMLVLNRADEKVGLTQDKVESTLGLKVQVSVPMSTQVANATNAGEPIVSSLPKHPVSVVMTKLARELSGGAVDSTSTSTSASTPTSPSPRSAGSRPGSRAATKRGLLRRGSR